MHPSEGKASLRARFSMVVQNGVGASGDPFGIPHGIHAPKSGIRRGSARDPRGIRAQNAGSCFYHRFPIYKNIDVARDPPQPNFAFIKLKRETHELFAVATCSDPVLSRILHRPVVFMPCNNSWRASKPKFLVDFETV